MFCIKQAKRLSIEKSSRHVTNLKILLAWCEVCSAIRDLKLCKCVSVAYCGKECQRADWMRHKLVCASSINKAILTEDRAALARATEEKNEGFEEAAGKEEVKKESDHLTFRIYLLFTCR